MTEESEQHAEAAGSEAETMNAEPYRQAPDPEEEDGGHGPSTDAPDDDNAERALTSALRTRLVGTLGMLGSQHDGERVSAALHAEEIRLSLGMTWDELIVPAMTRA